MFTRDQFIVQMDFTILRDTRLACINLTTYADDAKAKSCEERDVYSKSNLNDTFVKAVKCLFWHKLKRTKPSGLQADLTDTAITVQLMLVIANRSIALPCTENQNNSATELGIYS